MRLERVALATSVLLAAARAQASCDRASLQPCQQPEAMRECITGKAVDVVTACQSIVGATRTPYEAASRMKDDNEPFNPGIAAAAKAILMGTRGELGAVRDTMLELRSMTVAWHGSVPPDLAGNLERLKNQARHIDADSLDWTRQVDQLIQKLDAGPSKSATEANKEKPPTAPLSPAETHKKGGSDPGLHEAIRPSPKQARASEEAVAQYAPTNAGAWQGVGLGYSLAGDPAAAERAYTQALSIDPGQPDAYAQRGAIRLNSGNLAAALDDSRRALAIDPSNTIARGVYEYTSQALSKDAPKDLAKPNFGAMLAASGASGGRTPGTSVGTSLDGLNPTFTGGGVKSLSPSQALAAEAERRLKLGDMKGALLAASQAIDSDPRNPVAYAVRAAILNKMGNYKAAVLDATKALQLDPRSTRALNERSFAYNKLGQYAPALKDAETSLGLDPHQAMAHLNRAMSFEGLGRFEDALKEYKAAAQLDPGLQAFYDEAVEKYGDKVGWKDRPRRGGEGLLGSLLRPLQHPVGLLGAGLLGTAALFGLAALLRRRSDAGPHADGLDGGSADGPAEVAIGAKTEWVQAPEPDRALPSSIATGAGPRSSAAATIAPGPAATTDPVLIGGNFKLTRELGRGGMGIVFEALDVALQRKVAIKQMRPEIRQSAKDTDRFMAEARMVAQLKHPNLAEIYSILQEKGELYLVFEYVPGKGLDKILDQRPRLSTAEARKILADVCRALDYAHSKKVIHRDMKPSNIMVGDDGVSKVMDFGIAHQAKLTVSKMTSADAWGTPAYMPPEQELGAVSRESDLYALGAMAYEMMTGALPFPGPNFLAQKQQRLYRAASEVHPQLPKKIDAFFDKALHSDPAERFHTAPEWLRGLEAALT